MAEECVDALLGCERRRPESSDDGACAPLIFVDGTLGGGGHSAALLERLGPGDVVLGCDVDPSALSEASRRLRRYIVAGNFDHDPTLPLFVPVQSNFRDLASVLPEVIHPLTGEPVLRPVVVDSDRDDDDDVPDFVGVDGILLDLGVSSHQIDNPGRGFAFMKDGPLDMRMWGGDWSAMGEDVRSASGFSAGRQRGLTAADVCNEFDGEELTRIFKVYGDEPRARKISESIVRSRPLSFTSDLVRAVSDVIPEFARNGRRMGRTATLARVFQSLRIVVNEEDEALEEALLGMAPSLVRRGGRLVVLSYQSMEDRAAKRSMRDGTIKGKRGGNVVERDMYGNFIGDTRPWRPLGKRRGATEAEVETNSRARSASLRVAQRV